jgi:NifU-like protein involved in Fe-S cluster formation
MDGLYHARVLELAADIPHLGALRPLAAGETGGEALKVSKVCGSTVKVALALKDDRIIAIAVDPHACALGQASTAILALNAIGASAEEVIAARDALRAMLKAGGAAPSGRFWELRHLEGVRDYPPRHASTLLAFEAAVEAIAQARAAAEEFQPCAPS